MNDISCNNKINNCDNFNIKFFVFGQRNLDNKKAIGSELHLNAYKLIIKYMNMI